MKSKINVNNEKTRCFNTICIETSSLCNRKCLFCPNGYFNRPDEQMGFEVFSKIIDDLVAINYKGRVELYIYNEPTRDKRLVDLIKHVRAKLKSCSIMIATNGDYLISPEFLIDLFNAGLNQIQVNVYSTKLALNKLNQLIDDAIGIDPHIQRSKDIYNFVGANKRYIDIVDKTDMGKDFSNGRHHLQNRSGNISDFLPSVPEPLPKMCVRPFRIFNINWKGEALICCNDYYGDVKVGNVKDFSVEDLWNNEVMNTYRLFLQNKDRNIKLCDKCDFNGGFYTHMVNHITFGSKEDEEILKRNRNGIQKGKL